MAPTLRQLLGSLEHDRFRDEVPFTEEMGVVHQAVWSPKTPRDWAGEIISRWLQKHQPCLFGRAAARDGRIHYCLVFEHEIERVEQGAIETTILDTLAAWLERSRRFVLNGPRPAHGFLLCVLGETIANAAPDEHLMAFAKAVRSVLPLSRVEQRIDQFPLFLERPTDGQLFRFGVNLDYFGAQGDGRWWADHRFPGGIAFTLNSLGHQIQFNQWYEQRTSFDAQAALERARGTIRQSRGHQVSGKNTTFDEQLTPDQLQYLAMYDTDENIRDAFFRPPDVVDSMPYSNTMGLEYIVDSADSDHAHLIAGEESTEHEFEKVLLMCRGRQRHGVRPIAASADDAALLSARPLNEAVLKAIQVTRDWQMSEDEIREFYAED